MLPIRKKATCVRSASSLAISISHQSNSLGPEEIRIYQIYLAEDRKVSVGTRIVAVSACDSPRLSLCNVIGPSNSFPLPSGATILLDLTSSLTSGDNCLQKVS